MNKVTLKKDNIIVSFQVIKETEGKTVLYFTKQKGDGLSDIEPIIFKKDIMDKKKETPFELAVKNAEKRIAKFEKLGYIKL